MCLHMESASDLNGLSPRRFIYLKILPAEIGKAEHLIMVTFHSFKSYYQRIVQTHSLLASSALVSIFSHITALSTTQ